MPTIPEMMEAGNLEGVIQSLRALNDECSETVRDTTKERDMLLEAALPFANLYGNISKHVDDRAIVSVGIKVGDLRNLIKAIAEVKE